MLRRAAGIGLLAAAGLAVTLPARAEPRQEPTHGVALNAVVRDLCDRPVALLGEGNTHGDGETLAFKASLVRALVERCGFRAVYFEASFYDFVAFSRAIRVGAPVSEAMLASAIGGLWNRDEEFAPLVPFLFERARSGRLALGGIDDQVGSAGAFYSNDAMPEELAAGLPARRQAECRAMLRRRIYYDYPEATPYGARDRTAILGCLSEMRAALARNGALRGETRAERSAMLASIGRSVSRDLMPEAAQSAARERSMFLNFEQLRKEAPSGTKIIVWGATVHLAKRGVPERRDGQSFGQRVHRQVRRAFSLGFSAGSGSYRISRRGPPRAVPAPPPGSIEAVAMAGAERATYFDSRHLAAFGTVLTAPIGHAFLSARWDRVLDGLVVFREERPPRPASVVSVRRHRRA